MSIVSHGGGGRGEEGGGGRGEQQQGGQQREEPVRQVDERLPAAGLVSSAGQWDSADHHRS